MKTLNRLTSNPSSDLSSFAMLLLDSELNDSSHHHHHHQPLPSPRYGNGGGGCGTSINIRNHEIPMTVTVPERQMNGQHSPGVHIGGFKGLFRKRHKSSTSNNAVCEEGGGGTSAVTCNSGVGGSEGITRKESSPTSAPPGSKIRNIFGTMSPPVGVMMPIPSSRPWSKSDVSAPEVSVVPSLPSACAYKVETERVMFHSDGLTPRRGSAGSANGGDNRKYASSAPRTVPLNIYHHGDYGLGTPGSLSGSCGGMTSVRALHQSCRRSLSMRDSPIGPSEFLEMYRNRAYSESERCPAADRATALSRCKARQRRFSASPPFPSSGMYSSVGSSWNGPSPFEPHQLIIWRDQLNGTQVFRLPKTHEESRVEIDTIDETDGLMYLRFLKFHTCYDVIPTSTKLVVFDTELNVKKAFYALVYNGIRAAPLWSSQYQDFVGMLTITDFIKVLVKHHKAQNLKVEEIEEEKIENWIEGSVKNKRGKPLVCIEPEASMLEAVQKLCTYRVHRLPVVDKRTGNVLYTLTHKRLLRYVFLFFQYYNLPQPVFMDQSIADLNIGTYENLATVELSTPLISALELFLDRRISSLPVVDSEKRLLGSYAKFDVMNLAAEKTYSNLHERTIERVMNNRLRGFEPVERCLKTETLGVIVERIVKAEVHRLFIVDKENHIEGIISLSDILRYLVLTPPTSDKHCNFVQMDVGQMTHSSCN